MFKLHKNENIVKKLTPTKGKKEKAGRKYLAFGKSTIFTKKIINFRLSPIFFLKKCALPVSK